MPKPSFLQCVTAPIARSRLIDWPGDWEDASRPKLRVKVLGHPEREAAYFATLEHFRKRKVQIKPTDPAFGAREKIEILFRACEDMEGIPIAVDANELAAAPSELHDALYLEWRTLQSNVLKQPTSAADLDELVEELKKNSLGAPLEGCASSLLIALCRTLASRLAASTMANSGG